ncbi:MAG: RNase adapter RapZ [Thermodesulfovibrio sp.]|nr:RNase adapter RapZ [Thermodesulfovibrio sp.]
MSCNPYIVIVTGLSGAGKTVTLRTLEDLSFFCIDNLPPPLVINFIKLINEYGYCDKIAIGVDIRGYNFSEKASEFIKEIKERYATEILFLQADEETILRRYKETRRPHPLFPKYKNLIESIRQEHNLLSPLRELSDRIIDTTNFNPHELREFIRSIYEKDKTYPTITVISFGYKKGIPTNADLIFDVRYLPNPYFVDNLSQLTGIDKPVRDFVLSHNDTKKFIRRVKSFLKFVLPKYKREGRAYLTIAIGCTGGRHRSVVIADIISDYIRKNFFNVTTIHRDL